MNVIEQIEKGEIIIQAFGNEDGISKIVTDELLRLAKLGQQVQWVSIGERKPQNGQVCDVWVVPNGKRVTNIKYHGNGFIGWAEHDRDKITHWMPLPPAPKGAE